MSETKIKIEDGPVAVTGASGYIGSRIVEDLVEQGYAVNACVRDASSAIKTDHLYEMNKRGLGGAVELHEGDLFKKGSYDKAFSGCSAVIHAGATVGFNRETPQEVYDGCFTENEHVLIPLSNPIRLSALFLPALLLLSDIRGLKVMFSVRKIGAAIMLKAIKVRGLKIISPRTET